MKLCILTLFLLLSQIVIAQPRPGSPGYSPLPAKIVLDDFKSSSRPKDKGKISLTELVETTPSELLSIYANYEMDSAGVFDSHGMFISVQSKFMDLYLVYEYRYRLSLDEVKNINDLMPKILSKKGDQLLSISVVSYSPNNEKIKSRKIKKKFFQYSINNDNILIDLDRAQLIDPYVDITVLIKSRDLMHLNPIFSAGKYFSRHLECSLPNFLFYTYPEINDGYNFLASSETFFKVLELNRSSSDWDEVTKEYKVIVNNISWTITESSDVIKSIDFVGFDPSFKVDIGFSLRDILK